MASYLLLETGSHLLLEDGASALLLESSAAAGSVGTASGSGSAAGGGASTAAATATASGTSTATGVSPAIAPAADSLIAAVAAYWASAGLATTAGPLYADQAPPHTPLPLVTLEGTEESWPPLTAEQRPVEVRFRVTAAGPADAKARGEAIRAALAKPTPRDRLAWTTGTEVTTVARDARTKKIRGNWPGNVDAWTYTIHFTVWVDGTP